MTATFSASDWLRATLSTCHTADTASIVDHLAKAAADLDRGQLVDVVTVLAPAWIGRRTNGNLHQRVREEPLVTPRQTRPTTQNTPRLEGAAVVYRRLLAVREVGADGCRKFMRDMTSLDLRCAADTRLRMAEANTHASKRYARLADELDRSGVRIVADLPGDLLVEVLTK